MQVWCLHNAARYVFVPTEGPVVLFDFHNCAHLSDGNETVAEVRPAVSWFYFAAGSRCRELAARWAARSEEHTSELQSLMRISYAVFCLKKKKLPNILQLYILYKHAPTPTHS